jgi:hypothetical protein
MGRLPLCRVPGWIAAAAVAAACQHDPAAHDRPYTGGLASVERVEVVRDPPGRRPVRLLASGTLPDACTRLDALRRTRQGQRIELRLTTRRESGEACAPVVRPFARPIVLMVDGLSSGLYVVSVNGVEAVVEVEEDPFDPFVLPD